MPTWKMWNFGWKYQKYLSVESYHIIQSFNQLAPWIWLWIWNHVNLISYSILSRSNNDDSNHEILEIISNIHTLIKDSLNHHLIKISWMRSPLTRIDWFLVDLLTTSICNPPYPVSSRTWHNIMNEYEPKHGFMHTRFYDSLRSKDHMHYPTTRTIYWHVNKTPLDILLSDQFSELIL